MKKLSEYKDEEALELLADILDPITDILADQEVVKAFTKKSKLQGIGLAIKKHKRAVFECLAILEGVPVKDYHCNVITLPITILDIINDKDLIAFFGSQSQQMEEESSGSVTKTTKSKAKAKA